ncbi:MAG: hypothetical protein ACJ8FA_19675 [Xanthobacteraceae bacterium]
MKLCTAVIAAALLLAADAPARADEDCDTVVKALEDVQLVATKTLDQTMDEIKKATNEAADDKKKASVKNMFCSASGEYLGNTRAFRAVMAECLEGDKRRASLSSLDKSIKEMETAIANTCK